jgi:glucose-1-phosphate adenylyltransferase
MLSAGAIVSGSNVTDSVLFRRVHIEGDSTVERCILLDDVRIGHGSVIRNAIIDKNVIIPPGTNIGVEPESDEDRFGRSPGGVVTIGKKDIVTAPS